MSDDKFDQVVFKIFRMTHEGSLHWTNKPAPKMWEKGNDAVYPLYFETELQGRKLALYQSRQRTGSMGKQYAEVLGEPPADWKQYAHLALLGDNEEILFEFPSSRQIRSLLEAVRYREANVEGFLDAILKTEPLNLKE